MDQYILEQVENGNYIKINPSKACPNCHQLHFVVYNYVVSSTSSSTKVRMTTDSSMHTESGLSLNGVTQLLVLSPASEVSYSTLMSCDLFCVWHKEILPFCQNF